MSTISNRLPVLLCALLAVATAASAGVLAQVAPTTADVTPTNCGGGNLNQCGIDVTETCQMVFDLLPIPVPPYVVPIVRYECVVTDAKPMYSDRRTKPFEPQPMCAPSTTGTGLPTSCRKS